MTDKVYCNSCGFEKSCECSGDTNDNRIFKDIYVALVVEPEGSPICPQFLSDGEGVVKFVSKENLEREDVVKWFQDASDHFKRNILIIKYTKSEIIKTFSPKAEDLK